MQHVPALMPLLKPFHGDRGVIAIGIPRSGTADSSEPCLMVGADVLFDPRPRCHIEIRCLAGEINEDDSFGVLRRMIHIGLPRRPGLPPGKDPHDAAVDLQACPRSDESRGVGSRHRTRSRWCSCPRPSRRRPTALFPAHRRTSIARSGAPRRERVNPFVSHRHKPCGVRIRVVEPPVQDQSMWSTALPAMRRPSSASIAPVPFRQESSNTTWLSRRPSATSVHSRPRSNTPLAFRVSSSCMSSV